MCTNTQKRGQKLIVQTTKHKLMNTNGRVKTFTGNVVERGITGAKL